MRTTRQTDTVWRCEDHDERQRDDQDCDVTKDPALKRFKRRAEILMRQDREKRSDRQSAQVTKTEHGPGEFMLEMHIPDAPERQLSATWADARPLNNSIQFMFAAIAPDISLKVSQVVVIEVGRSRLKTLLTEGDWAANLLKVDIDHAGERAFEPDFSDAKVELFRSSIVFASSLDADGELRFYHSSPRSVHEYTMGKTQDITVDGVIAVHLGIDVLQGLIKKVAVLV